MSKQLRAGLCQQAAISEVEFEVLPYQFALDPDSPTMFSNDRTVIYSPEPTPLEIEPSFTISEKAKELSSSTNTSP